MAERFRKKKKICQMCAGKSVDYTDVEIIKKYISADKGKILHVLIIVVCFNQKLLFAGYFKMALNMVLLHFVN